MNIALVLSSKVFRQVQCSGTAVVLLETNPVNQKGLKAKNK